MITFENEYGQFEMNIGQTYDIDMVNLKTGEPYPHSEVIVIGETKDKIKTTQDNDVVYLEKQTICHVELADI